MASDKNGDGKYQNMVVEYIKKFDDYFYYASQDIDIQKCPDN